jgi:protein TonB
MPSTDDLAKVYPEKALRRGVAGEAVIECGVTAQGDMADCALASETPGNYGFGLAALRLAPLFNVEPKLKNGQPVRGAAVTIPVKFGPPS